MIQVENKQKTLNRFWIIKGLQKSFERKQKLYEKIRKVMPEKNVLNKEKENTNTTGPSLKQERKTLKRVTILN